MWQNRCDYSGHMVLNLAVSQEEANGINGLFCILMIQIQESYELLNYEVAMVKNGHGLVGHGNLKPTVSQERFDHLSWFFVCWYKFRIIKKYFNNYWEDVVKYGHCLLVNGALKSAVSPEFVDELSGFFGYWCKFRKTKNYFNNFWLGVVKNGCGLLGHGSLKSVISQKWFDQLSRFFCLVIQIQES